MAVLFDELFENEMAFPPPASSEEGADADAPPLTDRIFPGGGGVYLLTDAADRVVLLSAAADLRRALRGRLLEPAAETVEEHRSRRRADLSEVVRRIRWRTAHSMFELNLAYLKIARRLLPDSYKENLAFGPCWFVHVDPDERIPRFAVRKTLRGTGVEFGPLCTQSDASRLVQILEDAFDLCRYIHILEQVPHGQACAYFDMGRCPAPCDGSIPLSQYREMIRAALAFALGDRQPLYDAVETQMHEASTALAFEKAGLIKQRLERAQAIEHEAFRWVRRVEDFRFLVVQRGGGRSKVKTFFVSGGEIEPGEIVKLKAVKDTTADWIARLKAAKPQAACDEKVALSSDAPSARNPNAGSGDARKILPEKQDTALVLRSEQMWLVSHYLFKRDVPGLFFHITQLTGPDTLAERIVERFQVKRTAKPQEGEPSIPMDPIEPS